MEQGMGDQPLLRPAPTEPASALDALNQRFAAEIAARDQHWVGQLQRMQQALHDMHAQLTAVAESRNDEAQDRAAAETELHARRAQLAAQHLELETHRAGVADLGAQVAELTEALAAERQASQQLSDRAERLEAMVRQVASQSHDAALQAAGAVADAHDDAVKRGDELEEQVALHVAAVDQLRRTIEWQRADREQLMEERQAARTRCVELESQLHALTTDARHLAEGLQRAQAERDAERRQRAERDAVPPPVPRLRLAGTADSA
ncbi:MAG TPA: hypothetical protein VHD81_05290 [Mycobacteriales bacterium]|nr:hypothetical protein [Mycobacteriales bacterium]